ncbi:putative cytochrome p450 [Rosellinia necatrix]|uniref:Putative cytochrome p450 n=1 Tax=Rosellinia necatrix TaxID=77044 RepID=A0A1W2TPD5_ROSNE|nr:putative cytochrome p450 [Rosellinia necatrix]
MDTSMSDMGYKSAAGLVSSGIGAALAILLHSLLFVRGEWHVYAPQILISHASLLLLSIANVHAGVAVATYSYFCCILLSIATYRVFFHRLHSFPGPWYARVTKLWHLWAARNSKNHLVLDKLHRRFGDFVRTGPSEITVFHPAVFSIMDAPQGVCVKSEWYDLLHPYKALVTARSKSIHGARRRQWSKCFSTKAIRYHESKIFTHIVELDQYIESLARKGEPVQARDMFFWFGFDAMSDFVFCKSFNMLRDHGWHHIIVRLQRAMSLLGPFSPVPWVVQLGFRLLPDIWKLRDWRETVEWCRQQILSRLEDEDPARPSYDLVHYLVDTRSKEISEEDLFWLRGDSLLAIVAGRFVPQSDSLFHCFFRLLMFRTSSTVSPLHMFSSAYSASSPSIRIRSTSCTTRLPILILSSSIPPFSKFGTSCHI